MIGVKALIWDEEGGFAFSPQAETPWRSRQAHATCLKELRGPGLSGGHRAPYRGCNCGIHGLFTYWDLEEYLCHPGIAYFGPHRSRLFTAMLEASGTTIVHEFGWRAEAATIIAVSSAASGYEDLAQRQAADFFGVPILSTVEVREQLNAQQKVVAIPV